MIGNFLGTFETALLNIDLIRTIKNPFNREKNLVILGYARIFGWILAIMIN